MLVEINHDEIRPRDLSVWRGNLIPQAQRPHDLRVIADLKAKHAEEIKALQQKIRELSSELSVKRAATRTAELVKRDKPIPMREIMRAVSEFYGISEMEIRARRQDKESNTARQIVMYLSKKLTLQPVQSQ